MDPLSAALNIGNNLIERIWPDPSKQAEEKRKLQELASKKDADALNAELQLLSGQLKINQQEAAHKSIFVSGWRPFVGWVCGFGLLYQCVLERFIAIYAEQMPAPDTGTLITVLMGMLGLGGMRSFEKLKGISRDK